MFRLSALMAVWLLLTVATRFSYAWTIVRPASRHVASPTLTTNNNLPLRQYNVGNTLLLAATAGDNNNSDADTTGSSSKNTVDQQEKLDEVEVEEKEDPELTALKDEIADWEQKVKDLKRQVMNVNDRADDYSKAGYARKVAEMENMRRARSMLQSSNRSASTAVVLQQFVPILDQLEICKMQYSSTDFGSKYNALPGAMRAAMTQLGVTEFNVNVGDTIDKSRVTAIEERHDQASKGTILEVLQTGLELQGNVIRAAECVVSLGPEDAKDIEKDDDVEGESYKVEGDQDVEKDDDVEGESYQVGNDKDVEKDDDVEGESYEVAKNEEVTIESNDDVPQAEKATPSTDSQGKDSGKQ